MDTFITKTLQEITKKHKSFEDVVFILPSQRAGVFVKNELKNNINIGFLPEIFDIEHFIELISGLKKIDTIQQLFYFYQIYSSNKEESESFDTFSSWAVTALQDFNEIDQYLVNHKDLFVYLRDIERLKKWSVKGEFKQTSLMDKHFEFMENLGDYYNRLYDFLKTNGVGYQGLLYREATENTEVFLQSHQHKTYYFIGFNALNKAEEFIFESFLNFGNSHIFWDIDAHLLKTNHQAATFINKYFSTWKYYEHNNVPSFKNELLGEKNIQITGAVKNVTQIKYAGNILKNLPSLKNSALVLADESLLTVALSSLPKNNDGVNVTMGFPLKETPASQFIYDYFQLFLTQERLGEKKKNSYYFKDFWRFIKSPLILKLFTQSEFLTLQKQEQIANNENLAFLSEAYIHQFFNKFSKETATILAPLFAPLQSSDQFIERILQIINHLKEVVNTLEKEYLFRFYNAFSKLENWNHTYSYFTELKVLYRFYQQIIQNESISFQGEPLRGLQVMGMLETRVLDFENVIITSVNEGVLPSNSTQSTLIPFDVKVAFKLPTYREKDAIYSYHFFRLLQKAKNIFLIYNTDTDNFGKGERSRFLSQLELMRKDITYKNVSSQVITEKPILQEISKSKDVTKRLKEIATSGFSPSSIGNYLRNPIDFYKQTILGLQEVEALEETVAYNTMGTIIHEALYHLYLPYVDCFLSTEILDTISKKISDEIENQFRKVFKQGDFSTGKNKLIYEVSKKYIHRFITIEKKEIGKGNKIKIVALEQRYETYIEIENVPVPVKIKGTVDRIDEFNGQLRIIDYKSGKVEKGDLKLIDFSSMNDYKYSKAIQIMLYAFLYSKNNDYSFQQPLHAGIFSFKNLKESFLSMNFSSKKGDLDGNITLERLEEFMTGLVTILQEIFNEDIPFTEKEIKT